MPGDNTTAIFTNDNADYPNLKQLGSQLVVQEVANNIKLTMKQHMKLNEMKEMHIDFIKNIFTYSYIIIKMTLIMFIFCYIQPQ